ncbi:haloacid dehalogenase-like hydrolase [Pinirhizobacter soli]|uniref:haloacid dehalogenase-like hydrolase n=1 Tax=Pinirhizobacter soli TaxID=2786953 RepID=UPI00202A09F5
MTTGEAVEGAETPLEDGARVVLFDFDGVLIRGDSFTLFMRARYKRSFGRKLLALVTSPVWLLLAIFSRKAAAHFLVRLALLFVGPARYEQMATAFGVELARTPRLFPRDGIAALRRHLHAGERVMVVTACEETLARAILDELGLAGVPVLASTFRPGWLGMRVRRHNIGARKLASLAEIGLARWDVAYSDSWRDIPMLRPATEPMMVNATPRTCKRVEKALGRAVGRVAWY